MNLELEKIANAKKTSWLTEGMTNADVKTTVELAKISAKIERSRIDLGMTQKEFADYMGVSQSMVSKWESRDYNFTIKTLNEICQKLNLTLNISLDTLKNDTPDNVIKLDNKRITGSNKVMQG
jgi:DNA-binding transcriptional regulator YiaG